MPRGLYDQGQLSAVMRRVAPVLQDRTPATSSPGGTIRATYDIPMEFYLNAKSGHGEAMDNGYIDDMARRGLVRKIPYVSRGVKVFLGSGGGTSSVHTRFGKAARFAFRDGKMMRIA